MGELRVVRGRSAFVDLARRGRRARAGPLTVSHLPRADAPRFTFAISRKVGGSVTRNRLRRRLRALLREALADPAVPTPDGDYLVAATPAATSLSFEELRGTLQRALQRLGTPA